MKKLSFEKLVLLDFCVLCLFCVAKVKFTKFLPNLYAKRKNLVLFIVLLVFSSQVFADQIVTDYRLVPQHERSIKRITNFDPRVQTYSWEIHVKLSSPGEKPFVGRGYSESIPSGTAEVTSNRVFNQASPQGSIRVQVKELKATHNLDDIHEVWLVDEDSGYWLSTGVFSTDDFGNGKLNAPMSPIGTMPSTQKLHHTLELYDAVAVTLEPYPDSDPRPTDRVVLYGKIVKPKFFTPEPTVQQKLWGVNKYYKSSVYNNPIANAPKESNLRPERKYVYDEKLRQWVVK